MFGPREGVPKMSHSGITMALSQLFAKQPGQEGV